MTDDTPKRRKPEKVKIPRRTPSVVIIPPQPVYITPDKTTCVECGCFPPLEPYVKKKRLLPCLRTPPTLYELTAAIVDKLPLPAAFEWSKEDVANWVAEIGLPQYRECFLDNEINGMRLLMFEDPSKLPEINIKQFEHIKVITASIRRIYGTDVIKFTRSIGLPFRKPLTYCTWFKSRTGPSWGIHVNWTRCDLLRWMKIIMPEPVYMDHWDLVWYLKPDFPKVLIARVNFVYPRVHIPHYKPLVEYCREYMIPRKFRFDTGIPDDKQFIWVEDRRRHIQEKKEKREKRDKKRKKVTLPKETRLYPAKVTLEGKSGKDLVLARRKMPKRKFFY